MTFQEVLKRAGEYDSNLRADDPRFRRSVLIIHEDGSIFLINGAFLASSREWVIVFSEHHSYSVYDQDDLISYSEYDRKYNAIQELLQNSIQGSSE